MAALLACILIASTAARQQPPLTFLGEGRVVAIDSSAGTITLEHRGVPNVVPAGVTELPLQPFAGVEATQVGDEVRFVLSVDPESHGLLTITRLEPKLPSDDRRPRPALWLAEPVWLLGTFSLLLLAVIGAAGYAGWRSLRDLRKTVLAVVSSQQDLRHSVLLVGALDDMAGVLRHSYLPDLRRRIDGVRAALTTGREQVPEPGRRPYLCVVQRDRFDIFRSFKERLDAPDIAQVSWDRRRRERRTRAQPVTAERRRAERRGPPPLTWKTFGFVMVCAQAARADVPPAS